ncbi:hypothetical protein [Reichenbachiella versicolor]|uniref:hypothetical protein n=1 Tax=Reichenbachiella versicolor TaxID=1821036 RepID=UPI000D6E3628|nr:hypothetical protein [Reichenbachiella versicolor]
MKTIALSILLCLPVLVSANRLVSQSDIARDTILLEFGDKGKVMLIADDPKDFETMVKYDLNKMVSEISESVQEEDSTTQVVKIEDDEGREYLRDSTASEYKVREDSKKWWEKLEDLDDEDEEEEKTNWNIKKSRSTMELEWGLANWLEDGDFPDAFDSNYSLRTWGSTYFAVKANTKTQVAGPFVLDYGVGMSWYQFKLENSEYQFIKGDESIELLERTDINPIKSKLGITHINASFIPMIDFNYGKDKPGNRGYEFLDREKRKHFRIGVGGYVGYRIGSRSKFIYQLDGDKQKDKSKGNFYLSNLRYGVKALIGISFIDMFVQYDLNNVFVKDRGPQLQAVSFGIVL